MINKNLIWALGIAGIGIWIMACSSNENKKESAEDIIIESKQEEDHPRERRGEPAETIEPTVQVSDLSADVILGKWLRPDGNYVLEIKSIGKNGKLEAAYYNPRPIKMALSEVKIEDRIKVLIEFNDQGYEGSVYDLYYDEPHDALVGSYFQATYGQTYQIAFIRYNQ